MKRIETKNFELLLTLKDIPKPEIILWYCQGMYCLINIQKIRNAIEYLQDHTKLTDCHVTPKQQALFFWSDGLQIDPEIGELLTDECDSK